MMKAFLTPTKLDYIMTGLILIYTTNTSYKLTTVSRPKFFRPVFTCPTKPSLLFGLFYQLLNDNFIRRRDDVIDE